MRRFFERLHECIYVEYPDANRAKHTVVHDVFQMDVIDPVEIFFYDLKRIPAAFFYMGKVGA